MKRTVLLVGGDRRELRRFKQHVADGWRVLHWPSRRGAERKRKRRSRPRVDTVVVWAKHVGHNDQEVARALCGDCEEDRRLRVAWSSRDLEAAARWASREREA